MTIQLAEILALEKAVWQALVDGDARRDAELLSKDFLGVYPSGFSDRDGHIGQLADGASVAAYELSALHLRPLSPDLALLSYRADFTRSGAGVPEVMLVSSLWQREGLGWVNIFSQDTPLLD